MMVILNLAATKAIPMNILDLLSAANFENLTALDISIDKLHWECVRTLCMHGAPQKVPQFEETKRKLEATFRERHTVQVVPGGFRFLSLVQSVSIAVTDMAGVNKSKMKKMEAILNENDLSTMEDEVVGIPGGINELGKSFNDSVMHLSSTLEISESEALALLASFSYNEGAAIQSYINNKDGELFMEDQLLQSKRLMILTPIRLRLYCVLDLV